MLLSDDNSRSVLIRGAVCSVNDVVIRVPKTEHSFGGGISLDSCLALATALKKAVESKRTLCKYLCDHFHFRTRIFFKNGCFDQIYVLSESIANREKQYLMPVWKLITLLWCDYYLQRATLYVSD